LGTVIDNIDTQLVLVRSTLVVFTFDIANVRYTPAAVLLFEAEAKLATATDAKNTAINANATTLIRVLLSKYITSLHIHL
jgi:hypothetical protein